MAKVKIPKRVGGVKLPKKVRKKAKRALKMAESPVVRDFAAAALDAASRVKSAGRSSLSGANGRVEAFGTTIRIDGDRLVESIRAAALDGISRFLEGFEEGLRSAGLTDAEADALERQKRKRRSSSDSSAGAESD